MPGITERDFQVQVEQLARISQWFVHKTWLSMRSPDGWPDLFLLRGERAIVWEIKTEKGRATPAQMDWLAALDKVPGIEARIVKPSDWQYVVETLSGRGG